MRTDMLKLTKRKVTTLFGEIFDHNVSADLNSDERKAAVGRLAELFGTTSVTLDGPGPSRQNAKRLAGRDISGTVFDTMCYLIEKAQTYDVPIDSPRIWLHSAILQQEVEERLRAEFDAEIESLKADFARREAELTQAAERARADLEAQRHESAEQSRQMALDRAAIESERADLDAWRAEMAREAGLLAEQGHPRRVILTEMRDGGMLGASPKESVHSAQLRLMAMSGSGSSKKSRDRMIKEEAFHTIAAPVRWVLDVLLP